MRRPPRALLRPDEPPPPADRLEPGALLFGALAGPTACTVAFLVNLMLVRGGCTGGAVAARFALVALAAGVSLWAGLVARRSWRAVRDAAERQERVVGRNRFLALAGVSASAVALLLALYFLGVLLALDRCIRP